MAYGLAIRRDVATAADLRRLAKEADGRRTAQRMLAIANALEGMSRAEAARAAGIERQSLCDAVKRFNAEGLAGLVDRPSGHVDDAADHPPVVHAQLAPGVTGQVRCNLRKLLVRQPKLIHQRLQ